MDLGSRYASHYSADENALQALPPDQVSDLRKQHRSRYKDIAVDYYNLTTENIEYGWGPRFHFCPFTDPSEPVDTSLKTHEHFLALMMGLKPGMRGLDAGCGLGAPSRDLVRFVDVHITGVSINKIHVDRATEQAKADQLEGRLEYVEGDFMDLSMFADDTFDFAYAMEATVYAPDLAKCYTEIARVLKPGGVFAVYEWFLTDSFSAANAVHTEVRHRLERGDGITNMLTVSEGIDALAMSGLRLEHHEDRAEAGLKDKKWWYVIDGDTKKATTRKDWWLAFRLKKRYWRVQCALVWALEKGRILDRGRSEALKTQGMSVWGNRDGAKMGIFTPMYLMVGRKPSIGWKPKLNGGE